MQVITHNLLADFTSRQLNISTKDKAKSAEKLSTGLRINKSADDAAGLQITEKMRWLIKGLKKCDSNIQDGISLLQTADGALNEVSEMMHRLKELAVQGLNDTNTESDVDAIEEEMNALLDEIDSIAEKTTFNNIQLFNGDFERVTEKTITTNHESRVVKQEFIANSILPDWVKINGISPSQLTDADAKMIQNNSAVSVGTKQRTDLIKYVADPQDPKKIVPSGDVWTESLDDNYTGVIDFSFLAGVTGTTDYVIPSDVNNDGTVDNNDIVSVNNVALKLEELVNTGFSTGCCTCSERYGILFTTKEREKELLYDKVSPYRKEEHIKIYIDDLLKEAYETPGISGQDIADRLVQRIANDGEKQMKHFVHYTIDAADSTKLVVYDFRDDEPNTVGATINKDFLIKKKMDVTIPAYTTNYSYYEVEEGLVIQTGAEEGDSITLHSADISSGEKGLNLRGNIDILKKKYTYSTNAKTETKTYTYDEMYVPHTELEEPGYMTLNEHGEPKPVPARYKTTLTKIPARTETITVTTYEQVLLGVSKEKNEECLNYIDDALERLNGIRTDLGAQQNRLEFAKSIDNNVEENTQASESRIRDTDMAQELVDYSKHKILEDVGRSILTQANQSTQGVISLLQ